MESSTVRCMCFVGVWCVDFFFVCCVLSFVYRPGYLIVATSISFNVYLHN